MPHTKRFDDLTGRRFGMLTVLSESYIANNCNIFWECVCDCGNNTIASGSALRCGCKKSCGCLQPRHYSKNKRLYNVWRGMLTRCENPNSKSYKDYGARGISVCDEWHTFKNFLDWSISNGYDENAPFGMFTIDRIDTDKDYCPDNCQWVSYKQQARNNRHNHLVTIDGETMPLVAAAEKYGISINTVKMRIRNGWSDVDAVTTPSARANSERQKALLKLPYLVDQG